MFRGISLMNAEELAAMTRLIGHQQPLPTEEAAREAIITFLTRTTRCKGGTPEEVERTVLEWTAGLLGIGRDSSMSTDDLERALRHRIAEEAAEYLSPSWTIVCALIASGKKDNIDRKLSLMTGAAAVCVPSRAALLTRKKEWEELCRRWSEQDPREELTPHLEAVTARAPLGRECLTLGLALSLLDGGVAYPTERLYKDLADRMGMTSSDIEKLLKRVNDLYWQYHNAASPNETGRRSGANAQHSVITEAARQTVYGAGALEALASDARGSLINSMELEPKSGWSRLVGGLAGMNPFFSNKLKEPAQAVVVRLVYHTILKQHLEVAPEIELAEPAPAANPSRTPPVQQEAPHQAAHGPAPAAAPPLPDKAVTTVETVSAAPPPVSLTGGSPPPPTPVPKETTVSSPGPTNALSLDAEPPAKPSPPAEKPEQPKPSVRSIKLDL